MHRTGITYLIALTAAVAPVSAFAENDWKDGCPYYDDAPLPVSGRFGMSPELDTALGPSRVGVQYDRGWMNVPIDPAGAKASQAFAQPWTNVVEGVAQFNLDHPTITLHYGGIAAGDLEHMGNLGAALGYRYTDFALGNALRWGVAARLGEDLSLTAPDCQASSTSPRCLTSAGMHIDQHHDDLLNATIRSPFNARWFAFDRVTSAVTEARIEAVGCHSPFVHVRAEVDRWRTVGLQAMPRPLDASPVVLAIPITVTAGGYVSPRLGLAGELGVELRSPTSVVLVHRVTRVRARVDFRPVTHAMGEYWAQLHLGAYAGVVTGDARGVAFGFTLAYELPFGPFDHDTDFVSEEVQ